MKRQAGQPPRGSGGDYQLRGGLDGNSAHFRFSGRFAGRPVSWDCEFVTLQYEYQRLANSVPAGELQPLRCFIQIETLQAGHARLRVGLNIARVDIPAIEKMVLMIRNYRRLRVGRQEFGEVYPPPASANRQA